MHVTIFLPGPREIKMRRIIICTFFLSALSGVANADPAGEIQKCAIIKNAAERLFCYDSLAANLDAPAPAVPVRAKPAPATSITETRETPASDQAAENENFGLELQQAREGPDEINSRYDGSFKGWSGNTIFRLENGQVWRQAEADRLKMNAERPMITIKRGWFGVYYLKVEGANKRIRVKRIK